MTDLKTLIAETRRLLEGTEEPLFGCVEQSAPDTEALEDVLHTFRQKPQLLQPLLETFVDQAHQLRENIAAFNVEVAQKTPERLSPEVRAIYERGKKRTGYFESNTLLTERIEEELLSAQTLLDEPRDMYDAKEYEQLIIREPRTIHSLHESEIHIREQQLYQVYFKDVRDLSDALKELPPDAFKEYLELRPSLLQTMWCEVVGGHIKDGRLEQVELVVEPKKEELRWVQPRVFALLRQDTEWYREHRHMMDLLHESLCVVPSEIPSSLKQMYCPDVPEEEAQLIAELLKEGAGEGWIPGYYTNAVRVAAVVTGDKEIATRLLRADALLKGELLCWPEVVTQSQKKFMRNTIRKYESVIKDEQFLTEIERAESLRAEKRFPKTKREHYGRKDIYEVLTSLRTFFDSTHLDNLEIVLQAGHVSDIDEAHDLALVAVQGDGDLEPEIVAVEKIAEGGWSSVYRALVRDITGRQHRRALKVLEQNMPEAIANDTIRNFGGYRATIEALISTEDQLANLCCDRSNNDPHFLHKPLPEYKGWTQVGESHNKKFALIYELVDGKTVEELMQDATLDEKVDMLRKTAYALAYIHAKDLTHNDVKPGNVMIAKNGLPFLLDMALGCLKGESFTAASLRRQDPEAVQNGYSTPRNDQFSFGNMAHEVLTGEKLIDYTESTYPEFREQYDNGDIPLKPVDLPAGPAYELLGEMIRRCVREDGAQPYESMREVEDELQALQEMLSPPDAP